MKQFLREGQVNEREEGKSLTVDDLIQEDSKTDMKTFTFFPFRAHRNMLKVEGDSVTLPQ